eukprot:TRINITY_DN2511_c0_g1_i1.p1 TRINITY_DN2511_c0_g1~~TRINITY_DN2511_c0_g1_i1.p1  ORF type:complete len:212 (-),score=75.51 TRINITY_DN2511_c0_g1_i1:339-974(-)
MDLFDGKKSKIKNIFSNKRGSKVSTDESPGDQSGHTLDRIMTAKEEARRKWNEERENFERSRRTHELKMIDMEKAEVIRREKEIREQQDALDEQKRKNKLIQEKFVDQIKTLQEKLEEYKIAHKADEEKLEDDLVQEEDKLSAVKGSLEKRIECLEAAAAAAVDATNHPSAPPDDLYPTIPALMSLSDYNASVSPQMSRSSRSDSLSDCSA